MLPEILNVTHYILVPKPSEKNVQYAHKNTQTNTHTHTQLVRSLYTLHPAYLSQVSPQCIQGGFGEVDRVEQKTGREWFCTLGLNCR